MPEVISTYEESDVERINPENWLEEKNFVLMTLEKSWILHFFLLQ